MGMDEESLLSVEVGVCIMKCGYFCCEWFRVLIVLVELVVR
mgnify:CR=1 FL=1